MNCRILLVYSVTTLSHLVSQIFIPIRSYTLTYRLSINLESSRTFAPELPEINVNIPVLLLQNLQKIKVILIEI